MAFECQEPNQLVPSSSIIPPSSDLSCVLRPNFTKKTLKKQTLLQAVPLLTLKKSNDDDDSGSSGRRLITDLPPALVSEILRCLDVKDLGIVSCVSTFLHNLATNHFGWKKFYFERWGPPLSPSPDSEKSWKELFVERELNSKCFMGRYSMDILHGHTETVLVVFLLQSARLIFTAGYDSVVRMWDMEDGILMSASRPFGCTIRAIAADNDILVAGAYGSFIQCWRAIEGNPHSFDITGSVANANSEFRLWGHEGPITCLALDLDRIFSGSWDMSIRVWDRTSLKCLKKFMHGDWVWALVPRGSTVASTAGADAYIWDIGSGELVDVVPNAHEGKASSLAQSYSGDLLFTGGEDGAIHMFEVRSHTADDDGIRRIATWKPHTASVNSLAFEFPWLVSSSHDGRLALIDVRKLLQCSRVKQSVPCAVEPPHRMLHGFGKKLFSVAIGADRIVSGGEDGVVRVWNFSQALEIAKRAQVLRGIRLENRMSRRKAQIELNAKSGRPDQGMVSPKKNQMTGSRNGIWNGKQRDKKS